MSYYLTSTTREQVEKRKEMCKNLSLLLDKYIPVTALDGGKGKGDWLKILQPEKHVDTKLAERAYQRWHALTSAVSATLFTAKIDWRMVVGLGRESVLETDLTLHSLYGMPYVPGSALKGLTRAYVTQEKSAYYIAASDEKQKMMPSKDDEHDHEDIKRIFGTQQKAGTVVFFDAMPLNGNAHFELDIMNPHYPDYYQTLQQDKPKPPTNDQSPIPIPFLTVANTTFTFAIALLDLGHINDVVLVRGWLQEALEKYGVGGKTSAGYGYFRDVQNIEPLPIEDLLQVPVDPEVRKAEGYIREIEAMPLNNVANQIHSYYQVWQKLDLLEAKTLLAKAITEKVRKARREKNWVDKAWYRDLLAFVNSK